jgi:transcription elongation factor GreA
MDSKPKQEAESPLLRAEYAACVRQLEQLRIVRDRDIPQLLREARGFVASDADEEIVQVQNDLARVSASIERLERLLRRVRLVADDEACDVVALGSTVEVEYVRTGTVQRYAVVGSWPPPGTAVVSAASPVGRALMGGSPGDVVAVSMPAGYLQELLILSVGSGGDDR